MVFIFLWVSVILLRRELGKQVVGVCGLVFVGWDVLMNAVADVAVHSFNYFIVHDYLTNLYL